jgi:hypothetical protein
VEYQVKVLIGPADIRFELWFDNQKLSRDQSIKVDWLPAPAPDFAIWNRAELPESSVARPANMANPLAGPSRRQTLQGEQRAEENGSAGAGKKKGIGKVYGGLVSMVR